MTQHHFILFPGKWVGEGNITFSASPDQLHFYTRWMIGDVNSGAITCTQEVEMPGNEPNMLNNFLFSELSANAFQVQLENDILGKVQGKGIIDTKTIAWEFHGGPSLEGFEVYELQDNGDYKMHAEYSSPDQFRTIIDGRIWKKSE